MARTLDAYVYDAVRTPRGMGRSKGAMAGVPPIDLLRPLYGALRERQTLNPDDVDDIVLGCAIQTEEQGSNIAKISALAAGFGKRSAGMTLNRFCASGLAAVADAASTVHAGMQSLVVAGGVESMSRVSMFADNGPWFSNPEVSAATGFVHMGVAADLVATLHGITRDDCEALALQSHQRAASARETGRFARSLVPVLSADGTPILSVDESIRPQLTKEKLSNFPTAFDDLASAALERIQSVFPQVKKVEPIHTIATAPSVADGAALMLIGNAEQAQKLGRAPRGRIVGFANVGVEPVSMLTGTVDATKKALAATGLTLNDIDLFECNESFAAPALYFQRTLGIPSEKLNVNGGAMALGHPLGATGAILLGSLLDELELRSQRYGLATICAGAGIASAVIIERVQP